MHRSQIKLLLIMALLFKTMPINGNEHTENKLDTSQEANHCMNFRKLEKFLDIYNHARFFIMGGDTCYCFLQEIDKISEIQLNFNEYLTLKMDSNKKIDVKKYFLDKSKNSYKKELQSLYEHIKTLNNERKIEIAEFIDEFIEFQKNEIVKLKKINIDILSILEAITWQKKHIENNNTYPAKNQHLIIKSNDIKIYSIYKIKCYFFCYIAIPALITILQEINRHIDNQIEYNPNWLFQVNGNTSDDE